MALDREKTRKNAERLLQQGKLQAALDEYRRLSDESPKDLPLLNLVGDLSAKLGRTADAVACYERIAAQFTQAGFHPKAIAILKKILRLDPDRPDDLVRIGELYLKQELPGEARPYLLHAADRLVKARAFRRAREIYQRLATAEPKEPLHLVRLAEAFLAEGNPAAAGDALLFAARALREAGRLEEAERVCRRALEVAPDHGETVVHLASCLAALGREGEAIAALEARLRTSGDGEAAGTLLGLYARSGPSERIEALLRGPHAAALPDEALEDLLKQRLGDRDVESVWRGIDEVLRSRGGEGGGARAAALLERLARVEPRGHVPALKRLCELRQESGDREGFVRAANVLISAYRSQGMGAQASAIAASLRGLGGGAAGPVAREAPAEAPAPVTPPPARPPGDAVGEVPPEVEAPAVPLDAAGEEFVSGKLTQAEIFEKYGLGNQALEQLVEVTERFPGHVEGVRRLTELLRRRGDASALRGALVKLAIALRAAGEEERATEAARAADQGGRLKPEQRALLARMALLPTGEAEARPVGTQEAELPRAPATGAPPAPAEEREPLPEPRVAEVPAREKPVLHEPEPVAAKAAAAAADWEEEEVIVFEDAPAEVAGAAVGEEAAAALEPPGEDLEEIAFFLDQGMVRYAGERARTLRARGFGGAALDALEERIAATVPPPEDVVVETVEEPAAVAEASPADEDDLSSFARSLAAELEEEPAGAAGLPPVGEQSVEEVLAVFKRHVESEVPAEDFRTHYDLGIAYKEMGLLEDAVSEFLLASRAPELLSESCSMAAMCHRERGDLEEAKRCYGRALEAPGGDEASLRGLRYDLAEVLLESGDTESALKLFRTVQESDPSYREVSERVRALESGATS